MKLSDIKTGDTIIADAAFTCIRPGEHTVEQDEIGLFIACEEGRHYLDGQQDAPNGDLVGLIRASGE